MSSIGISRVEVEASNSPHCFACSETSDPTREFGIATIELRTLTHTTTPHPSQRRYTRISHTKVRLKTHLQSSTSKMDLLMGWDQPSAVPSDSGLNLRCPWRARALDARCKPAGDAFNTSTSLCVRPTGCDVERRGLPAANILATVPPWTDAIASIRCSTVCIIFVYAAVLLRNSSRSSSCSTRALPSDSTSPSSAMYSCR